MILIIMSENNNNNNNNKFKTNKKYIYRFDCKTKKNILLFVVYNDIKNKNDKKLNIFICQVIIYNTNLKIYDFLFVKMDG